MLQYAAHPDTGCLTVFLDANAFALQVLSVGNPGILVDENVAVAKDPRRKNRDGNVGKFSAGAHDHVVGHGHLGDVE